MMPPLAPIVILLFLAVIGATVLAAAVLVYALARKLPVLRNASVLALVLIPMGYAGLVLAGSLESHDRVLPPGASKYFCEIDCHLAYSVERVERAKTIGPERAAGIFTIVTLKTWFDEGTISPQRPKDAPLTPNPRRIYMSDAVGHRYPLRGVRSTPLSTPLVPGESYRTELIFDLPDNVREPKLFVGDADPVSSLLLLHEQGPLHRKIWFAIE